MDSRTALLLECQMLTSSDMIHLRTLPGFFLGAEAHTTHCKSAYEAKTAATSGLLRMANALQTLAVTAS